MMMKRVHQHLSTKKKITVLACTFIFYQQAILKTFKTCDMMHENFLFTVMMKSISDLFVVVSAKTVQYILIELPYILLLVKSIH